MGKTYDKELVPTQAQRLERQYPSYALSTPRLRVQAAKAVAKIGSLQTIIHEQTPADIDSILDGVEKLLLRLVEEGPHPVFDEMELELGHPIFDYGYRYPVTPPLTTKGPR